MAEWCVGLMSGTSVDGIDCALIQTDGERVFWPRAEEQGKEDLTGSTGTTNSELAYLVPYDPAFQRELRSLFGVDTSAVLAGTSEVDTSRSTVIRIEQDLTERHAAAVAPLLARAARTDRHVALIGMHGQTVFHRPASAHPPDAPAPGITCQLGDGNLLAELTKVPVVFDFRTADVALGGEGAPLVPVFHQALCRSLSRTLLAKLGMYQQQRELVLGILNLGGVGNITFVRLKPAAQHTDTPGSAVVPVHALPGAGEDFVSEDGLDLLALDTGPGNALVDDWMLANTQVPCDFDGVAAASGTVDGGVLAKLMAHPYFDRVPPKSLDRQSFALSVPECGLVAPACSVADGAATLTAFTAASAIASTQWACFCADGPKLRCVTCPRVSGILVCGGGRRNATLMRMLRDRAQALAVVLRPVEDVGWDGDLLEAQAFAFLAKRVQQSQPTSFPRTTRVSKPVCGGRIAVPQVPQAEMLE
ncbi:anhydro-N-acetylmuramic acid kinase [Capsaspora owczarzaki ATCC 30864]|nr:anhydro-N-acetylmuramic acid kinase [Capsaspora owczarzaki ATCC 30864]|eukprot:XP_004348909.2 anhydro-N-acetylmuramic acid kinase [Capsaspora owczarzaki ATCC 30864]